MSSVTYHVSETTYCNIMKQDETVVKLFATDEASLEAVLDQIRFNYRFDQMDHGTIERHIITTNQEQVATIVAAAKATW